MILIVGDLLLDFFNENDFVKNSPEAKISVVKPTRQISRLGGAANVASNINSLSKNYLLLSRIGRGSGDKHILKKLSMNQIKYKLFNEKNYTVGIKNRYYIDSKQIVRIDQEKLINVKKDTEDKIVNYITKHLKKFSILVISDYNKGIISKRLFKKITGLFLKENKLVITNPKKKDLRFYDGSNIIVPNEKEFNDFFKKKTTLDSKISSFFSNKFLSDLIITRGNKSLFHFNLNKKKKIFKIKKIKTFDVTGASDTFIGVLAVSILSKNSLKKSILKAISSASIVVKKKYTSVISLKEYLKIK